MMGTQRAFLSPASSPANNGLHKYEHIKTQGGAQVSTDQTSYLCVHYPSLSVRGVARMREDLQIPDVVSGVCLVMERSYEDVITAASRQVYTCTLGPWGDMAGVKCEIFTRDPV